MKQKVLKGSEKRYTEWQLAEVLAKNKLSAEEALQWRRELETARKALKIPTDKW